ncbi:MAG: hypothetical protein Q8P76_02390 [bacterium]|nr:hypothetical protein [bacterium]
MGIRTVRFQEASPGSVKYYQDWLVQIVSVRRRHTATTWEIEGIVETSGERERVSIYYCTATREGRMRFVENLQINDSVEASNDAKRASALMTVIERMVSSHSSEIHCRFFQLFEKAKLISRAKDSISLAEAIRDI